MDNGRVDRLLPARARIAGWLLRFGTIALVLATALSVPLAHAEPASLLIGGVTIQFPVEPGYIRASQAEPRIVDIAQASLPPTNRLVDVLLTPADIARMKSGGGAQDIYYQVQVLREIEARDISIDDWNSLKPQITSGMAKADLNQALDKLSGTNDRLSAIAGKPVGVSFGKMNTPTIYRETPMSVAFTTIVPVQVSIDGTVENQTMGAAGAFAVVRNRLIYIYAFSATTSDSALANLRTHLDAAVDQTLAMNPSDASVASSGGSIMSGVGRATVIGGLIGAFGGLIGWLVKRRKG